MGKMKDKRIELMEARMKQREADAEINKLLSELWNGEGDKEQFEWDVIAAIDEQIDEMLEDE